MQNEYRDSLNRMQRKAGDSSFAVIDKHETLYRSIEERVADAEDGMCNTCESSFLSLAGTENENCNSEVLLNEWMVFLRSKFYQFH